MSWDNQQNTAAVCDQPHCALRTPHSALAWAGWRLEMPATWQPLKLTGTPARGEMMVGDSTCALFRVQWERRRHALDQAGRDWVADRIQRHGVLPDRDPPAASHFTACGWACSVQSEEEKPTTYWYGYSAAAELLLGVTVNGVLPAAVRAVVTEQVLPSLRATPAAADSLWAMYDLAFVAPAGFELSRRHLYSGDVALEFVKGRRETLWLRQVYPGDLALERRSFERWLDTNPFPRSRQWRTKETTTTAWSHPARPEWTGCRREGWHRLAWPLGWVAPRAGVALAVQDRRANRLLIAEHAAPGRADAALCATALARMNGGG